MGITINNSQDLWLGFSLRSTPQHMWVMWVYIVWIRIECISIDSSTKQNVSQVSYGKALPARHSRNTAVSICSDSSHSSHVQGTCITSRDAYLQTTRENTSVFNALSLHTLSLSHTTLTNKSHMKYRVQKIEHNYNQIWHGIKSNKNT